MYWRQFTLDRQRSDFFKRVLMIYSLFFTKCSTYSSGSHDTEPENIYIKEKEKEGNIR